MKRASPILLLILGLLAGFPAARLTTAPVAKPEPPAKTEPAAQAEPAQTEPAAVADQASLDSQNCKPEAPKGPGAATATAASGTATAAASLHPWCMPVRLLRDFFGLPAAAEKRRADSLKEIVAQTKTRKYDLLFMVALVPALPDPRMDQALDAIQRGFAYAENQVPGGVPEGSPPARASYLLDRVWLPWINTNTGDGAPKPVPGSPGVLLFRGDESPVLELVFLVPETSKMGIQKDTFREALDLIADLKGASKEPPQVAILGPSFSGSVESLHQALLSWRQRRVGEMLHFRAASGSASADNLEKVFDADGVSFCRMTLPDSVLQDKTLGFLHRSMGWNLRKVGLLVEDDTRYGQSFVSRPKKQPKGGSVLGPNLVLFTFPSHLSDLRSAWEDEQKAEQEKDANPIPASHRALGLDLSGHEQEADLVPVFSSTTTSVNDLLLTNLLQTISREGLRYVGIVSTDPMDKLFLAEKLRQLAPDVVLFTFDNNLLYAHPDYAVDLDGMLVLGTYPLYTEGAPGFPSLAVVGERSPREHWQFSGDRRQFGSEYQQGVFEATRYLLGTRRLPEPQAWIAAVGNGSLWPIAQLRVDPQTLGDARFCGHEPNPKAAGKKAPDKKAVADFDFDGKDDLQILLVAGLFCLLAVGLRRAALLEPISEIQEVQVDCDDGRPVHDSRGNRRLLMAGIGLLATATGVLLAVATVPLWSLRWSDVLAPHLTQLIYLTFLAVGYAWLVGYLAYVSREKPQESLEEKPQKSLEKRHIVLWAAGGAAAFALLVLAVYWLCVPGDQRQLFYLRVRALSSGLSPVVPLAMVGGAIYFWIWSELKRRRLLARLVSGCPLESLGDPAVTGCTPMKEELGRLLNRTWPRLEKAPPWPLPTIAGWAPVKWVLGRRLNRTLLRRLAPEEVPPWILPVIAFVPPAFLLWGMVQPIGEARGFGRLFVLLVLAAFALSALSFYRFARLWWVTLRILQRLDNASPEVAAAFKATFEELHWRPIQSFGWQIPPFCSLLLSIRELRELVEAGKVSVDGYPTSIDDALRRMFDGEGSVREIESRSILEGILAKACCDLRPEIDDPEVKKFLALRVAAYLRFVFAHLRSCLIGAFASALLTLLGITTYAFEPKHLVSLGGWLALGLAVVITLWIFLQMDRNPTLSLISNTPIGKVRFDRTFVPKLITFGGIPAIGLIATQSPEVGRLLGRVVSQFLRVVGGG